MSSWDTLFSSLPWILTGGVIVGFVWSLRHFQFPGFGEAIHLPAAAVAQLTEQLDSAVKAAGKTVHSRAVRRIRTTVQFNNDSMAAAVLVSLLGAIWIVTTGLLVLRSTLLVQRPLAESQALKVVVAEPAQGIVAMAEILGIVVLTAVAGLILTELVGLTRHVAFIQQMRSLATATGKARRAPAAAMLLVAASLLFVAAVSQGSIAREEREHARGVMEQTILARWDLQKPPLPLRATADEQRTYNAAVIDFEARFAVPTRNSFEATNGPSGRRTLLPIVAIVLDAVLAWAFIDMLIIVVSVLVTGSVTLVRIPTLLLRGVGIVGIVVAGVLMRVFNVADEPTRLQRVRENTRAARRGETPSSAPDVQRAAPQGRGTSPVGMPPEKSALPVVDVTSDDTHPHDPRQPGLDVVDLTEFDEEPAVNPFDIFCPTGAGTDSRNGL